MEEKRGLAYLQDELRKMGHTKPSRESKAVKDVVRILARDDGWISEAASDLLDDAKQAVLEAEDREESAYKREEEAKELIDKLREKAIMLDEYEQRVSNREKVVNEREHDVQSIMQLSTEAGREKLRLANALAGMVEIKSPADNTAYIKALGNILAGAATKDSPRKGA